MARYIEAKTAVNAESMSITLDGIEREGYKITLEDESIFWIPKEEFERDYIPAADITDDQIDSLISSSTIEAQDDRTLLMTVTLNTGETFVATHSWVDPTSYNIQEGENSCLESIRVMIRESLKFTNA